MCVKEILLLIGFLLIVFGLIGLVWPTRLHQKIAFKELSLGKRWWNLVPLIIGIILAFSILTDILFAIGCIASLFGLIGMIRPTQMHEAVKIGQIHFANRPWNLGLFVLGILIIAVFAVPSDYVDYMSIRDKNQKLVTKLSELEEKVKELTQECRECEETEKKQLAELDRLEKELTAASKIVSTSDPANSTYSQTTTSTLAYRGANVVCDDFSSTAEATAYMIAYDLYKLDRDGDGIACEALGSGYSGEDWYEEPIAPPHPEDVTCAYFSSSAEATAYMNTYGVYKLDRDGDGIACESLESGGTDESEEGTPSPEPPDYNEPTEPEMPEYEEPEEPEYPDWEYEYPDWEAPSSTESSEYESY
jgi:multisubunit Na+/H+ antiporter MnhG subunit